MFKWLTDLFKNSNCNCNNYHCENDNVEIITFSRRGFPITIDKKTYDDLRLQGYTFHLALYKGKPTCVHLKYRDKKKKVTSYVSSLKEKLKVKSFKDGNVCNFNPDNLEKE